MSASPRVASHLTVPAIHRVFTRQQIFYSDHPLVNLVREISVFIDVSLMVLQKLLLHLQLVQFLQANFDVFLDFVHCHFEFVSLLQNFSSELQTSWFHTFQIAQKSVEVSGSHLPEHLVEGTFIIIVVIII